eukprot:gnl/TRDRNA2_/TRDRNA2_191773_c0_seq1.p1 gnl/TRDRNA2_/TRDRNA2_191773_c0~~gnl/TRDRNA2_/TRDRNA2_191773_c0_seq1.p1  ORF type:complete len:289 (+),score=70.40 gnl/TRDRNA2_/TRDRNA2_191773_c0_seq1:81-947(+)
MASRAATTTKIVKKKAAHWKEEGNACLKIEDHESALECYAKGIAAAKTERRAELVLSQLHSNRAHVYLLLAQPIEAIEECNKALAEDEDNAKAYWRGAKAALSLKNSEGASLFCRTGIMQGFKTGNRNAALEELVGKHIDVWKEAAEKGSAAGQFTLGLVHLLGLGVKEDQERAFDLWNQAAEQDDAIAIRALADFRMKLEQGTNTSEKNTVQGSTLQDWERQALEGDVAAQFNLGLAYLRGDGVAKDEGRAIALWKMAADKGDEQARNNLVLLYKQLAAERPDEEDG